MPNFMTGKSECHHCNYNVTKKRGSVCKGCKYLKPMEDSEFMFCEMHSELKKITDKSCLYYT